MNELALRIALLCPGPSLASFPGAGGYDLTIAVNRAAAHTACNYWVCCDADSFPRCVPVGEPTIVCSQDQRRLMERKYRASLNYAWRSSQSGFRRWPSETFPRKRIAWHRFSSTVALGLVLQLVRSQRARGERRHAIVDCYGVDWAGKADWDGTTDPAFRRDDVRWQTEQKLWGDIVADLAERNIEVRRINANARSREEA